MRLAASGSNGGRSRSPSPSMLAVSGSNGARPRSPSPSRAGEVLFNPGTSLTTVNHRFGIQQPTIAVQEQARCNGCGQCAGGYKQHLWRKVCRNCFCPIEDHEGAVVYGGKGGVPTSRDSDPKSNGRSVGKLQEMQKDMFQMSLDSSTAQHASDSSNGQLVRGGTSDGGMGSIDIKYNWTPRGLDSAVAVEQFMTSLSECIRPQVETEAADNWYRKQVVQFPIHDVHFSHQASLVQHQKEIEQFLKMREKNFTEGYATFVERPLVCAGCSQVIQDTKMAVRTEQMPDKSWHPTCFTCTTCKEFLVNLAHHTHEGKLYCGRHHAELFHPRCGGCDELIFDRNYTLAEGKSWHIEHFKCFYCDHALGLEEEEYIVKQDKTVCFPCYKTRFTNTCHRCSKHISPGQSQLKYDDHTWHEACFLCDRCNEPLDSNSFIFREGGAFCRKCFGEKFLAKCAKCEQAINGSAVSAMKNKYHTWCFTCGQCKIELVGEKFYKRGNTLYCKPCYSERFDHKCEHCKQAIRDSVLRHKGSSYHRQCFQSLNSGGIQAT